MINYKISEHLKKQLDNSKHNKYKEIQNFIYELLNPPKRMPYHLELQNFLGWIDSPEFMIKQIEGINDFVNKSKSYDQFIFIGMGASAILPELLLKEKWINKRYDDPAPQFLRPPLFPLILGNDLEKVTFKSTTTAQNKFANFQEKKVGTSFVGTTSLRQGIF